MHYPEEETTSSSSSVSTSQVISYSSTDEIKRLAFNHVNETRGLTSWILYWNSVRDFLVAKISKQDLDEKVLRTFANKGSYKLSSSVVFEELDIWCQSAISGVTIL